MFIDYSKVKDLPEGALEILNSAAVQEYAEKSFNNRIEVVKQDFKSKMDNMDSKLKSAEETASQFKGLESDEIEILKEAKKKNPELQATLDAYKTKFEEKTAEVEQYAKKLKANEFKTTISQTVSNFNTQYPDVAVRDDARDIIAILAEQSFKEVDGRYVPHNTDGTPLVTDNGYGNSSDWIQKLRKDRPSLFNSATGSGATGSKTHTSSADKTISRSEFEQISDVGKKSEVARSHTITD